MCVKEAVQTARRVRTMKRIIRQNRGRYFGWLRWRQLRTA